MKIQFKNELVKSIFVSSLLVAFGLQAATNTATQQTQKIVASNPVKWGEFGESVAINEDQTTLVVGSWRAYDGSGAAYVFQKDSNGQWQEVKILTADSPGDMDHFGEMVAISGDTIVVGSMWDDGDNDDLQDAGAAFVYTEVNGDWNLQQVLRASNAGENDRFGKSVAIDGDTIVIGARLESSSHTGVVNGTDAAAVDDDSTHSGAAYIFERTSATWTQAAYLKPSYVYKNNEFGRMVGIDNGVVAVGAPYDQSASEGSYTGAVYLFEKNSGIWSQTQQVLGEHTNDDGKTRFFGMGLGISGNTLAIGSHGEDDSAGAVYVFDKVGSQWTQSKRLIADNRDSRDEFGFHLSIDGDVIVVGAVGEDSLAQSVNASENGNGGNTFYWHDDIGAAYTFRRSNGVWSQQDYLKSSDLKAKDKLGQSVAVSGDMVVVGADAHDTTAEDDGAAYIFAIKSPNVGYKLKVAINNLASNETLVLLSNGNQGDFSLDGSYTLNSGFDSGDSYAVSIKRQPSNQVCEVTDGESAGNFSNADITLTITCRAPKANEVVSTVQLQKLLAIGDTEKWDEFGESVAISKDGKIVVVGAWRANGTTGAAYVFERDDNNQWQAVAVLTAPAADAFDHFGETVDVDDDTIVVGSMWDDGDGNGIEDAGAAFVYMRNNGAWSYQQTLRASNPGANDRFGKSVAIDDGIIVVGARLESSGCLSVINGGSGCLDDSKLHSGAAYIFEKNTAGNWAETAYLKASNADENHQFGMSVAVDSGIVAVGAPSEGTVSTNTNNGSTTTSGSYEGAAYLFSKSSGIWQQIKHIKGDNPNGVGTTQFFGQSVAVSAQTLLVGSPYDDDGRGAAYLFDGENDWAQSQRITASNVDSRDEFGDSVAIDGDVLVIGSRYEDGPATGVNSDDMGNGTTGSDYWMPIYYCGAAYTFVRNNGVWTEQDYLKSSDLKSKDKFGQSVAIAGQFIVVGADQHDTTVEDDGAAYIFALPGVLPSDGTTTSSNKILFEDSLEDK